MATSALACKERQAFALTFMPSEMQLVTMSWRSASRMGAREEDVCLGSAHTESKCTRMRERVLMTSEVLAISGLAKTSRLVDALAVVDHRVCCSTLTYRSRTRVHNWKAESRVRIPPAR